MQHDAATEIATIFLSKVSRLYTVLSSVYKAPQEFCLCVGVCPCRNEKWISMQLLPGSSQGWVTSVSGGMLRSLSGFYKHNALPASQRRQRVNLADMLALDSCLLTME